MAVALASIAILGRSSNRPTPVYSGLLRSLRSAPVYFLDNKSKNMVYKTGITVEFIEIIEKKAPYSCLVLSLLLFAIL
jgi:hypothetical protein